MTNYVFCDEAGYTGDNLLDKAQPIFVYATVNISPDEAKEVVEKAQKDYKLDATELKGGKLVRQSRGRKAIHFIESQCLQKSAIFCADKTFALASKVFEFVIEPIIAKQSFLFYNYGFHRFISNALYISMVAQAKNAAELMEDFCHLCINGDVDEMQALFKEETKGVILDELPYMLLEFARIHRDNILEEIGYPEIKEKKFWHLELSTTALFNMLAIWGEKLGALQVYCDESKPVLAHLEMFNSMIGRGEKGYIEMEGESHPILFNLERPIELVESKKSHGIQVADCIASSFCAALKNRENIKEKIERLHHVNLVFPDPTWFDINEGKCIRNTMILHSIIEKSTQGIPVLQDIHNDFIAAEIAHRSYLLDK